MTFRFTRQANRTARPVGIFEGIPAGSPCRADVDVELKRRMGGYGRGARMKVESDHIECSPASAPARPRLPIAMLMLEPRLGALAGRLAPPRRTRRRTAGAAARSPGRARSRDLAGSLQVRPYRRP